MNALATPDISKAQWIVTSLSGVVVALLATATDFGWVTVNQATHIGALWTAMGSVIVLADAHIRHGRSIALATAPKGVVADDTKPPMKISAKTQTVKKAGS